MTKGVNIMTKRSKEFKDLNPLTYGYPSPTAIPGNEGCGEQVIEGKLFKRPFKVNFASFVDADGDTRFVECSEEFAYWQRNYDSEIRRKEKLETRCSIPMTYKVVNGNFVDDPNSNHKNGYKKCTHDCKKCPYLFDPAHPDREVDYHRTGSPVSMNITFEDKDGKESEIEYADPEEETPIEKIIKEEREEAMWRYVLEFDPDVQDMLRLYNKGKSYSEIARIMNRSKSAVQERVVHYIKILRDKLKDF